MIQKHPIFVKALSEIFANSGILTSNSGCNDWKIPYTDANWKFVQKIFRDGIKLDMWDNDCQPTKDKHFIYWTDFVIHDWVKHKIEEILEIELSEIDNDGS